MTIAFKKVREKHGWLSNMSPHPVQGFRTAEALFQAGRFGRADIIDEIRAQTSPMAAKMVAKKHSDQMAIHPRSPRDIEWMESVLRLKLKEHPSLVQFLKDTGTEYIVEDVSSRPNESGLFWGASRIGPTVASMMEHLDMSTIVIGEEVWYGQNVLGKLWMKLREEK